MGHEQFAREIWNELVGLREDDKEIAKSLVILRKDAELISETVAITTETLVKAVVKLQKELAAVKEENLFTLKLLNMALEKVCLRNKETKDDLATVRSVLKEHTSCSDTYTSSSKGNQG